MSGDHQHAGRARLMDGLNYLRRHAIEAYQCGDGFQVLHCCAQALRTCQVFGKANPTQKLKMQEIHWAFVLGMYCVIYDWFLMLVREAIEQTDCEGESSTDRELVVLVHNLLFQPHEECDISKIDEIPKDWWKARSSVDSTFFDEDRVALSFLIELIWYCDPTGTNWERLIERWLNTCPHETVLHTELSKLHQRLHFQSGIFTGIAFQGVQENSLPIDDAIQRDLFLAWVAYYNCDWGTLKAIHARLKYRITVDHPAYVSFFYLQLWSLTHRDEPDDQFISLPRLQIARSRQPARLFQHFRDSYGTSQFLSVANASFPQNAKASERIACLRMVMLCSLEALRTWDIGDWISTMRDRAQSRLELGALGDSHSAIEGIIDSLRGLDVPDAKDSPRFAMCLRQFDTLSSDRRIAFVQTLLHSPPIAWRKVHTILCELSDAIPEDQLIDLTEWSLKVESTDLFKNHWVHTLLDVWNKILPLAPAREELVVRLAPALRKATASKIAWDKLHDTILAAILWAPEQLAVELVDILISTDCEQVHWNQYRFSIAINVIEKRPRIGESLLPFLRSDVEKRNDLYQRQLLKRHDLEAAGKPPDNDAQFRRAFICNFQERLEARKDLQGPSIPIGQSNFYDLSKLVSWPRPESALLASVVEAIDSESVLFSDKFDYLAFLANLVKSGPAGQAKAIAAHAVRWLKDSIPGRDIGPKSGGPLSTFQFSFGGQNELRDYLLFILEQSAIRCPDIILGALLDWLPLNVSSHVPKFVSHFLTTTLALTREAGKKSGQDAAMLVGLADAVGLLAIASKAATVIDAFRYVVLDKLVNEFADPALQNTVWARALFQQWSKRLLDLSQHSAVEVRESVACAATQWAKSALPHSDQMKQLQSRLAQDCRLRVRNAVHDQEP